MATIAAAEPVRLDEAAIRETFAGAGLEFDSPIGVTVPVQFGRDGLVSGQSLALAAMLGAAKDRGRWWIADGKLCSKWFRWLDAETRCAIVRRDGDRLFFKSDNGEDGTATLISKPTPLPAKVIAKAPAAKPPVAKAEPQAAAPPAAAATEAAREAEPQPQEIARAAGPAPTPAEQPQRTATPQAAPAPQVAQAAKTPDEPKPAAETAEDSGQSAHRLASTFALAGAARTSPALDTVAAIAVTPTVAAESRASAEPARKPVLSDTSNSAKKSEPGKKPEPKKSGEKSVAALAPGKKAATKVSAAAPQVVSYRVVGVEEDDTLNVRIGPSSEHEQVDEIGPDARGVTITGACKAEWCPIKLGRTTGWVNRFYLAEDAAQPLAANRQPGRQDTRAR